MLTDTSYLDNALSQGELVKKILHGDVSCSLLRVVFPLEDESGNPHGLVYLDYGDPDRLLRLQPGTHISNWLPGHIRDGVLSAKGPVLIKLVERADAVQQTMMAAEIWADDDGDASSHPVAWGVYLALLRKLKMVIVIPPGATIKDYHFDTLGAIAGNIDMTVGL